MEQRREIELLDSLDAVRNKAKRRRKIAALEIHVYAETRLVFKAIGKVNLALSDELCLLLWRDELADNAFRDLRRHDRLLLERHEDAVNAQRRPAADRNVQVGSVLLRARS